MRTFTRDIHLAHEREERVVVFEHDGRRSPDVGKSRGAIREHNVAADTCKQPLIFTGCARATGLHLNKRKREPYLFEIHVAFSVRDFLSFSPSPSFSLSLSSSFSFLFFLFARRTSTAGRKIFQRRLKAAVGNLAGTPAVCEAD